MTDPRWLFADVDLIRRRIEHESAWSLGNMVRAEIQDALSRIEAEAQRTISGSGDEPKVDSVTLVSIESEDTDA